MCGLVGAFSRTALNDSELNTFANLLYCSALRGNDSTGVMLVTSKGYDMYKAAVHPADFISEQLPAILDKHKGQILGIFGHTRLATSGKVNTTNAHPFFFKKKIMMMHNGNVQSVPKVDVKKFDVDSMAIAQSLHEHEDPKDVFSEFFGAGCVLWFDIRKGTFNIFRNYERPLAILSGYATSYLASEKKMLEWVASKHRTPGDIKEIDSQKIITYDAKDFSKAPEVVSVPFATRTTVYTGNGGTRYDSYYHGNRMHHMHNQGGITTGKVLSLPQRRADREEDEDYGLMSKESPILSLKSYGPFETKDPILLCPVSIDSRIYDGTKEVFRVTCLPLGYNWTDLMTEMFGDTNCVITIRDKEEAHALYSEPVLEGIIANILYNRTKQKMADRLTVFLSSLKKSGVQV